MQEKLDKISSEVEAEREANGARFKELEDQVGKAGTEEAQKAFEAQLARERATFEAKEKKAADAYAELEKKNSTILERRRKDLVGLALENAMTKAGITDPNSRENARKAFLFDHGASFAPGKDDETTIDGDHHTVSEVFENLVNTASAYQQFIPAKNSGGGASGSSSGSPAGKNVVSRERFDAMSPREKADFSAKGGKIG